MQTERKKLIRPITILKVKNYMKAVAAKVSAGENFSLDQLAREHQIGGSHGTQLLRQNWIEQGDVKGEYKFAGDPFVCNDQNAKLLIEQVRLANQKAITPEFSTQRHGNDATSHEEEKDEQNIPLKMGRRKEANLAGILEKALSGAVNQNQMDIFEGAKNTRAEQLMIVTAIAGAIYSEFPEIRHSEAHKEFIPVLNQRILFAASDLMKQFESFKFYKTE